ncbi:lysophospholipase [Alicyclobacillus fastidiosus]|uniref:Lysophospholipase n=1 Tax=Alicyclobacillus fastidiosus TaxID=392011 RepID=A0ABY6ZP62_9BACL|nr:alpha/beta fold hydrolase [Alicyclobacillus fastidiosus]WAH43730.1 lysophospholipase [Alicyclobacillus fastidiosus]
MQRAIELEYNGRILRGMEHVPDGATHPLPAVVLYHGFAATCVEPHRLFVKICRALESVGVASFRFDFSGSGESDGNFEEMTVSGEISEAHAIFDWVQADPRLDPTHISVVGLSMGGLVASQVAGARPKDIRRLVLLAPGGGKIRDIVLGLLTDSGTDITKEAPYYDYLGNLVSHACLDDLSTIDVYRRASHYTGPVLIIHGTEDAVVPVEAAIGYQERAYNGRAMVHLMEGADHTFDKREWEAALIDQLVRYVCDHP